VVKLHSKIEEFKKRSTPISYFNVNISERKSTDFDKLIDQRIIEGYGVIWGSRNGHGEKFVKGAFAKSISEMGPGAKSNFKIKFRDRHGKSCSLFAELIEDEIGLYFKTVPLDNVPWANDLLVQIKSGTINNFSVGFRHIWDKVEWEDETDSLIILEARLFEISGVDIPSDLETYCLRGLEDIEELQEDVENFISDLPNSQKLKARHIFTRCMSLKDQEPLDAKQRALENVKPTEIGIDYKYLIDNLKF